MTITEHDIEQALKHLQKLTPTENSLVRVKNVVMAQVRRNAKYEFDTNIRNVRRLVVSSWVRKIKFAPAMAVVLIVLLGGGGTVAAAQNAIPGDALYQVKLASESVVAAVLPTKKAKVNFEAKRAERRAQELVALTEKAETTPPAEKPQVEAQIAETTTRLEAHLEQVREVVEELKVTATPEALQTTTQVTEKIEALEKQLEIARKSEEKHPEEKRNEQFAIPEAPSTDQLQKPDESPLASPQEETAKKERLVAVDQAWEAVQEVFDLQSAIEDQGQPIPIEIDHGLDKVVMRVAEAEELASKNTPLEEFQAVLQDALAKLKYVRWMLNTLQNTSKEGKTPQR